MICTVKHWCLLQQDSHNTTYKKKHNIYYTTINTRIDTIILYNNKCCIIKTGVCASMYI